MVMSAATQIAIEEYLKTTYRPDREYIDGEVRERNLGEEPHSLLQSRLVLYFSALESQVQLIPYVDCRVQVSATRFRVPDLSVVRGKRPQTKVLVTPPLIVVEIQSPEDSWYDMADRIADYVRFEIPNIWVIDPVRRLASWIEQGSKVEAPDLVLETTDKTIRLPMRKVFEAIDRLD